jgi:hypothetical protein
MRFKQQESGLRDADIRQSLENAHFIAAISREVEQQNQNRLVGVDASGLNPLDALKIYLETRNMSQEKTKLLLDRAQEFVAEEKKED